MCPVAPITTTRATPAGYSARVLGSPVPLPTTSGTAVPSLSPLRLALQDHRDLALRRAQRVLHGLRTGQGSLYGCPHLLGDLRVLHAQAERAWMREQRLVDVDPPRGACLLHVDLRH